MRSADWEPASEVRSFELGDLRIVVADFETAKKRSDGMPVGFRRIALFDASGELLAQETIKMSEGGADLLEHELRDVDGDGALDLLLYYSVEDQWNPRAAGWLVATARGKLIRRSLTLELRGNRRIVGSGCWATVDGALVQILLWQESGPDRSGQLVVHGYRVTAGTLDADGYRPVRVFGLIADEGQDGDQLDARVPAAQRPPELESPILMAECSQAQPTVLVTPAHRGWVMLSGLSLRRESAGASWPAALARKPYARIFEILPVDPTSWQTNPDPK
jgi:hypothetical protein